MVLLYRQNSDSGREVGNKRRGGDCVGFFPPTPGGELNLEIDQVLKEEGRRINMNLRAIETGGVSLGKMLVHPDHSVTNMKF